MEHEKKYVSFKKRMVILGCGSIGQGVLPLIFRHIEIKPENISIITSDSRGIEVANYYGISFFIKTITPENYHEILKYFVSNGDFLLNLSADIDSNCLIDFAAENEAIYLDTCIASWLGKHFDKRFSIPNRSLYSSRERAMKLREKWGENSATAILAHGANPGIVSHLVKQALLNIARDTGHNGKVPAHQNEWAKLAQDLNIKVIHIAECDTQVSIGRKLPGEFVNTWSIDGFVSEALQPSELGWGSHEKYFPEDGARYEFGSQSAIYLKRPGATVRVRSWLPLAGPKIGFMITHNEVISLASYLSIGTGINAEYRPTVYYSYHPCDDAILSLIELEERNRHIQKHQKLINSSIVSGIDELGVLLMGNAKGSYWFGSRLDIQQARNRAPFNSATSLQVTSGVIAGIIWAMQNPNRGIIEAEDMDFQEILNIVEPYWGPLVGQYSDWNPIDGRGHLFDEDIDADDIWQFKNFRVT